MVDDDRRLYRGDAAEGNRLAGLHGLCQLPRRRVLALAYLAVPIQYYWIGMPWYGMFIIFIPVYMFLLIPASMVLAGETKGYLKAAGTIHWGLMTCVFAISHAAA